MALETENIIVGAAEVFMSRDQADLPETFSAGVSARTTLDTAVGWENAGFTTGGIEVAYAPDFGEVEVDQLLDAAKIFKQRQSVTVSTTFAEPTLVNLLFAWGQPTSTLTPADAAADAEQVLVISAGALGEAPQERSLAFVGPAPGVGSERVYHLERVLSVESSSHSLSRSDPTTVPVSLRCLPNGDGEYGRIIQRVIAGTGV